MGDNRNQFSRDPQRTALIERVDTSVLAGMGAIDGAGNALRTNFLPTNFLEAMEMAKLMSAGTFVPTRLRGKPGDCLAVVMQATRWGMDPFAVAQKIYFVNNDGIPGYEAQLVVAVINTSGVLKGKLTVEWFGENAALKCRVTGTRIDDPKEKTVEQELATIKTRNSPLWAQSPRQQLAYYTQRLWGRLYAPEVMLGVYTADELVGADGEQARRIEDRPPTPSRDRRDNPAPVVEHEQHGDEGFDGGEEDEEEIARRLDNDPAAYDDDQSEADDDDADDQDDAEQSAAPAPTPAVAPTPAPEPAINWEAWLEKLNKDLAALNTIDEVNAFMGTKAERLKEAPSGIANRAGGYHRTRVRALTPKATDAETRAAAPAPAAAAPQEEKPKSARKRAAAAADAAQATASAPTEQASGPADDAATGEGEVDARTQLADSIIAEMQRKEMLVDLRALRDKNQADIDAMDEENSGRVMRAFRAREDQLASGARR